MKMMTARDSSKNIAGGFYVDQNAAHCQTPKKPTRRGCLLDVTGLPIRYR